jgi:SAM-dependent methyltransferase
MKKQTSWGNVAEWYDESLEKRGGTYQKEVILPHVLRLVGTEPKTILDLACGQGFFSRELARANAAHKICASDISSELIALAKKNPDPTTKNIEYHVRPATDISFCKDKSVDTVLISLAIQNIEQVGDVFQECSRVLKEGKGVADSGQLILILNHPAFRIPKRSSWEWRSADESADSRRTRADGGQEVNGNAKQYRRLDGYMSETSEKIDMTPGEKSDKEYTVSFHRPLQVYVKTLAKAGFAITKLEEWISHKKSEPGPRANEEDRMRKEIPMFLMIEARKLQ